MPTGTASNAASASTSRKDVESAEQAREGRYEKEGACRSVECSHSVSLQNEMNNKVQGLGGRETAGPSRGSFIHRRAIELQMCGKSNEGNDELVLLMGMVQG